MRETAVAKQVLAQATLEPSPVPSLGSWPARGPPVAGAAIVWIAPAPVEAVCERPNRSDLSACHLPAFGLKDYLIARRRKTMSEEARRNDMLRTGLAALFVLSSFLATAVSGLAATIPVCKGKIVFSSNERGNAELFLVGEDGTGKTQLTSMPATMRSGRSSFLMVGASPS
jgi:hypothetical protein